eukprot:1666874-Prymnesium_polylepis.2
MGGRSPPGRIAPGPHAALLRQSCYRLDGKQSNCMSSRARGRSPSCPAPRMPRALCPAGLRAAPRRAQARACRPLGCPWVAEKVRGNLSEAHEGTHIIEDVGFVTALDPACVRGNPELCRMDHTLHLQEWG